MVAAYVVAGFRKIEQCQRLRGLSTRRCYGRHATLQRGNALLEHVIKAGASRGAGPLVAHLQVSDLPGRHEPGSGGLDWAGVAGFATGFFRPALYAGLPNLVDDEDLETAPPAWNSTWARPTAQAAMPSRPLSSDCMA